MSHKQIEDTLSFADIAIQKYVNKNHTMTTLRQIDSSIDWTPVELLLLKYYHIGKVKEGVPIEKSM